MGSTALLILLTFAGLDRAAAADNTTINVFCAYGYDCGSYYVPYRLNIFDDRVFDLEPPIGPSNHPLGDCIDYNSAQRETWVNACRPHLQTSFIAFQTCFREHQARNANYVKRQREAVQNR